MSLKNEQFIRDEVKPMVRKTVPDITKRLELLEKVVDEMTKAKPKAKPK